MMTRGYADDIGIHRIKIILNRKSVSSRKMFKEMGFKIKVSEIETMA